MTDLDAIGPTTEPVAVRRRTGATLLKFGAVGVSGLVVNLAALAVLSSLLHLHYIVGVVLATQVSTGWNYYLSDRYV